MSFQNQSRYKFEDERDSATKLLDIMNTHFLNPQKYLILCTGLESVIIADIISRRLKIPFEIMFCEKIYAPNNKECEIAMVSEVEEIVMNDALIDSFEISLDYVYGEAQRKYEEKILKSVYMYRKGKLLSNIENKSIILLDANCESGLKALTCIKSLMDLNVKSIIYATPIIAQDVATCISFLVDDIFAFYRVDNFIKTDYYYSNLVNLKSNDILSILVESQYYLPLQKKEN